MFDFFSSVPFFLFLSVLVALTKKSEFWNYLVGYQLAQRTDQNPNCWVAEKDARFFFKSFGWLSAENSLVYLSNSMIVE